MSVDSDKSASVSTAGAASIAESDIATGPLDSSTKVGDYCCPELYVALIYSFFDVPSVL